jgi:hypothetical protein
MVRHLLSLDTWSLVDVRLRLSLLLLPLLPLLSSLLSRHRYWTTLYPVFGSQIYGVKLHFHRYVCPHHLHDDRQSGHPEIDSIGFCEGVRCPNVVVLIAIGFSRAHDGPDVQSSP